MNGVAAFLPYDDYDNFRLLALSWNDVGLIRNLDLEVALGNAKIPKKLFRLVRIIDPTNVLNVQH